MPRRELIEDLKRCVQLGRAVLEGQRRLIAYLEASDTPEATLQLARERLAAFETIQDEDEVALQRLMSN